MGKIFEDEFMEVQSDIISLCLELVENRAEMIYAYGSIEEESVSFDVFYKIDGNLVYTNELNKYQTNYNYKADSMQQLELLKIGTSDLKKIREVCTRYKYPIPTELKMIYNVETGQYDADYKHEPICTSENGIDPSEIFNAWFNEIKEQQLA